MQKPTRVSREGVVLIKSFEGFRPRAVQGADGRWVIGYGHTLSAREGLTVSEADAELLLQYDLLPVVKAIQAEAQAPLNQHQFDALASFAFSVGVDRFQASDVLARINAGAPEAAADALIAWPEGPETPPRRRAAERALFVAAPDAPVALADLLAAPLPPPAVAPAEPPPVANDDAAPQPGPGPEPEAAPASEPPVPPSGAQGWRIGAGAHQFYSPYSILPSGTLPPLSVSPVAMEAPANAAPGDEEAAVTVPAVEAEEGTVQVPDFAATPAPLDIAVEPEPEPASGPTPVEPLVLTAPEAVEPNAPARVVWPEAVRASAEEGDALFDAAAAQDEGLGLEMAEPAAPRRFDWSETGTFLAMGGIGLVSFGAAMAAFRRAGETGGGDTALIGWVLAVIALACVTVSGYNLYQRWGRADRD